MLALSRKSDYALVALAELAARDGEKRSAAGIAQATDAPESLMRNVLKNLTRAGLLLSERGPFGGYTLAREPDRISVLEVLEAVDGPISLARCCKENESPQTHGCIHSPRCRIQRGMRLMHQGVLDVLRGVSVSDLIDPDQPEDAGVVPLRIGATAPDATDTGGCACASETNAAGASNTTDPQTTPPLPEDHG